MSLTLTPIDAVPDLRAAWCERITESWRESVLAIVETGRLLNEAKDALDHGEWLTIFERDELPFGERVAQMLMRIAKSPRLANPQIVALLPPSYTVIYKVVSLPDEVFNARLSDGTIRQEMTAGDLLPAEAPLIAAPMSDAEAGTGEGASGPAAVDGKMVKDREDDPSHKPADHRATMAGRQEADDSLDFFPTGPWITRALMERVLPHLGVGRAQTRLLNAWEPACGEGHMTEVLAEYFASVYGTDIHDYSFAEEERHVPHFYRKLDFLGDEAIDFHTLTAADWIITNPPFGDKLDEFIARALDLANVGVAIFAQVRIAEGIGRYEAFYRDNPPTLCAFFVERAACIKGRWDPANSTATAYWWLIWIKGEKPRPPFWIPPGCRESLTKPDDVERFTCHPVRALPARVIDADVAMPEAALAHADAQARQRGENLDGSTRRETSEASASDSAQVIAPADPQAVLSPGPSSKLAWKSALADDDELLDVPKFLRRGPNNEVPA